MKYLIIVLILVCSSCAYDPSKDIERLEKEVRAIKIHQKLQDSYIIENQKLLGNEIWKPKANYQKQRQ